MFVQRAHRFAHQGTVVNLVFVRLERPHLEVRCQIVPHSGVATDVHVVIGNEWQPGEIVGESRADAAPTRLVPPVLYVAVLELSSRGAQQMRAGHRRLGVDERHAVLELIAESVRTARLINGGARPHPAGERLIERPPIHQRVELDRWRADLNGAEARRPRIDGRFRLGVRVFRRTAARDDVSGCRLTTRGPQQQDDVVRFARVQGDRAPQRRAGIEPGACVIGQLAERQRGRITEISVAPDERGAIAGRAGDWLADPGKGHLRSEILPEEVLREDGARRLVAPGVHLIARLFAIGAECPLHVTRHDDAAWRGALVAETKT